MTVKCDRFITYPNSNSRPIFDKLRFKELPKAEKNMPPIGKPPFYTHYKINKSIIN